MINNRQAGRRRGRGGGNGNNGGNGQRQGGGGMQGNGSRIDNRARGNATQLFEKYKNMASEAQRQGDRVNTEYYLQFADHYFRVLSEQRGKFEDQQPSRQPRNDIDYDGDDEFGDEGEPIRTGEQGDAPRADRDADRDQRPREFRRDNNRDGNRDTGRDGNRDAPRDTGRDNNEQRQSSEQRPEGRNEARSDGRQDGPRREWRERDDRAPRRNDYRDQRPAEPETVAGQRRAEPIAPGVSLEQRAEEVLEADRPLDPPAARRRGRPRREDSETVADVEATSSGLEADRLPPALTPALAVAANEEAEPAPRRRRVRRPVDETPTAAE